LRILKYLTNTTSPLTNFSFELSATLDALYLSLLVSGVSLFICLCFMGCFANRLASRPGGAEKPKQRSIGSSFSLASGDKMGSKGGKKTFGKVRVLVVQLCLLEADAFFTLFL
jgi:hypothetical protein